MEADPHFLPSLINRGNMALVLLHDVEGAADFYRQALIQCHHIAARKASAETAREEARRRAEAAAAEADRRAAEKASLSRQALYQVQTRKDDGKDVEEEEEEEEGLMVAGHQKGPDAGQGGRRKKWKYKGPGKLATRQGGGKEEEGEEEGEEEFQIWEMQNVIALAQYNLASVLMLHRPSGLSSSAPPKCERHEPVTADYGEGDVEEEWEALGSGSGPAGGAGVNGRKDGGRGAEGGRSRLNNRPPVGNK